MRPTRPFVPVLLLVLAAVACAGPGHAALSIGQPAPDFALTDLDGATHRLSELAGRTVVLEWMNPNCPFSLRHSKEGTMQATADAHGDVVWLAINSTNPDHRDHLDNAEYKAFLAEHGIGYPVLEDPSGEVGHAYDARTTPHMYVIDGEGKLAYQGAIDDDPRGRGNARNYVGAALSAMAAGEAVDPTETKPYGCSIKY